ncbi:MAG: hypothetical protein OSA92_04460 [Pirellulaceae bacterium]|nr:hypothetical protein [Pirellulaceae bacterium]
MYLENQRHFVAAVVQRRDKPAFYFQSIFTSPTQGFTRRQLDDFQAARQANDDVKIAFEKLEAELIELEAKLYLLNATGASENLLRFPSQLYSHFKMFGYYVMTGDAHPTRSKYEVYDVLTERLRAYEADFDKLIENQLAKFNELLDTPNQIRVDIEEDNE